MAEVPIHTHLSAMMDNDDGLARRGRSASVHSRTGTADPKGRRHCRGGRLPSRCYHFHGFIHQVDSFKSLELQRS